MNRSISQIEESIRRMTAAVRQDMAVETAMSFGEEKREGIRPLGWWVLACGEPLDEESFDEREKARERLLVQTRKVGLLPENIWVWDDSGNAQLVISTVPSLERAEKLAHHLREKGLTIKIKREKF